MRAFHPFRTRRKPAALFSNNMAKTAEQFAARVLGVNISYCSTGNLPKSKTKVSASANPSGLKRGARQMLDYARVIDVSLDQNISSKIQLVPHEFIDLRR